MFGHSNDDTKIDNQNTSVAEPSHDGVLTHDDMNGSAPSDQPVPDNQPADTFIPDDSAAQAASPSAHDLHTQPSPPMTNDDPQPQAPPSDPIMPTEPDQPGSEDDQPQPSTPPADADELIDIKQHALQQLSPLVDHLDQTPEEKFQTTMMMIQASDNQALIQEAYKAAQQIDDEKAKAQALLDIVNEINYFTQHSTK